MNVSSWRLTGASPNKWMPPAAGACLIQGYTCTQGPALGQGLGYCLHLGLLWRTTPAPESPLGIRGKPYSSSTFPFVQFWLPYMSIPLKQQFPTFFGTRDQFHGRQFFHRWRVEGMVSGWFKCITCIVHFISIIITSTPSQIIRH